MPATDVETLLTMNWDPNLALSITSELVVMEVINRIFICIFEVSVALQVAYIFDVAVLFMLDFQLATSATHQVK